ncbi:TPA: hypothetical protein DCP77_01235 [Candidatus Collierbacteria bacterium]|nr:MAG: hypothetical protein UV30_C0016G0002 [Candidatus Collierbacteria bacterium GW2011_GWF1_42_50]KKS62927.1 MAG: hypothetical protein UV28_C0003G0025 [Candidatus Collierbacteria bacterium GW2011_GWE2_42_48]KKS63474.1 MAG: hypothetical protein UV29_C0001G0031 [Candidatus Collierbacteria bacterium GW2011_GWD2_42_50]KKS64550.1 MAG: hypothetical protein UV32_C0012G0034 [Candidatus Collierbacteria bacterium GW2011_GWF2_42_51]HAI22428.1 hypothetical protein [Candidatus Collierbacteria bacterium]
MRKTALWGTFFVVLFLLVVGGVLILNLGWIKCSSFIMKDTGEKASCGVWRFDATGLDSNNGEKYVGYGRVVGIQSVGQNVILRARIGLGGRFFYIQNFRLSPRDDGKFEISEERRKWIGYFDNSRMIRFGMEEVPTMQKELRGKEVMLTYVSSGDDKGIAWKRAVEMGSNVWEKIILMFKGLLNINTLDATQAGY